MCLLPSRVVWGRSEALHIAACALLSTLPLQCKVWKIEKFGGIILYTIADVCMGNLLQALWSVRDDWCWVVCHSKFRITFLGQSSLTRLCQWPVWFRNGLMSVASAHTSSLKRLCRNHFGKKLSTKESILHFLEIACAIELEAWSIPK